MNKAGVNMNLERKVRTRDVKGNPTRAIFASVFVMFIISAVLLLLLATLLYKMELTESVVKIGVVVIYVISGIVGGIVVGKIMREQKYLWGLASGICYFAILFLASMVVKGGFDIDMAKVATTFILCAVSGMAGGMVS